MHNDLSGTVSGAAFQIGRFDGQVYLGEQPHRPASEADPVPHEVPVPLGEFVNRARELSQTRTLLDPESGRVRVAVFTGLPGVGKTAVVQRAVALADGAYPGGELYVDFARLREGGGAAVNDGLADCLRALGVEEKVIPPTLAARSNLYRTRTRTRPMVVVLDDVAEPAEVAPFVPSSAGSTVLVTSNRQLSELLLDEAAVVSVEPLSDESGVELLGALCGPHRGADEPEAMRELAGLCGGLPVALRVAAARLRSHPSLAVADLVAEVVAEDSGLAPFEFPGAAQVSSVLSACYRDLPSRAARLYRTLGCFPGTDFDSDLVIALGDGSPAEERRALAVLVEANLVIDKGTGRYRMHSLVRRHARGCADNEGDPRRRDVLGRTAEHFLRRAAFADLAVMGPGRLRITEHPEVLGDEPSPFSGDAAKQDALEWLDEERPNLMAVLRSALDENEYRTSWQLAEAMTALFVNLRYLEDWVESSRLGVWAARLDEAPQAAVRLGSFVSRAYTDLGRLGDARAALDEALPRAEASGNPRLLASVWELVGRLHDEYARTSDAEAHREKAVSAYQRALELFAASADDRGTAFVMYFLGRSQLARGNQREALATLENALERIRAVPDDRMAGRALAAIGLTHHALGDGEKAVAFLQRAIDQLVEGKDDYYEAQAREDLAAVAGQRGERELQREQLRRALEIHVRFGSPRVDKLREALDDLSR
ncbi:NB-ARC domain-containing protein [Saccharopolyspora taberi]|uniref:NB-ARC domain-containing protein n=1 Tax=Saccharopolyspora taberi TaxID=60895 RepID=UPI0031D18538